MYTSPLRDLRSTDIAVAGGKGANLGEMLRARAGLPVPDGFVATTAAYDRFVTQNGLGEVIARALGQPSPDGAAIREAFRRGEIPSDLMQAVIAGYEAMGRGPVAVRSSATAEDLPGAAFAGQQDSFLNIAGTEPLLDAVRLCWASLWNDRAIAYRTRQGIDQQHVKLAVVVQRQIAAEAAGVMFTANPVTGERRETVIYASPGLGEAVVSGLVTPDRFVMRWRGWIWHITERQAGRREVIITARQGGGTERSEAATSPEALSVSDSAVRQLAGYGAKIERVFGSPQDVEWAIAKGKIHIVQSRPMTALPPPPLHPGRIAKALAALFSEMFPVRPYPLDATAWIHAVSKAAIEPVTKLVGVSVPPFDAMFVQQDDVLIRFSGKLRIHPTPAAIIAPARIAWTVLRYDPRRFRDDQDMARANTRAAELQRRAPAKDTWQGLLDTVDEAVLLPMAMTGQMRRRYLPGAAIAALQLRWELNLLRRTGLFWPLLSGADSMTFRANHSLEELGDMVRADARLANVFARHEPGELLRALENEPSAAGFLVCLRAFLEQYGHRETVFSSVLQPTWQDAPEIVLGIIKGFAGAPPATKPKQAQWEQARDRLLEHPVLRFPPFRRATLRLLSKARCLWQIREDTHFNATLVMPILRRTFLEMGRRLGEAGVVDIPEDVFHLKLDELRLLGQPWPPAAPLASDLRTRVVKRKALRLSLETTPLIDLRLFPPKETGGTVLLRGSAGSPGVAAGPVRVIHNATEFGNLLKGEVLVTPYTNPSWTMLFQTASAVVVDGGAAGSHAAIVAREYGIPAVMGTVDGTRKLVNGQRVRIDGSRGIVYADEPADQS